MGEFALIDSYLDELGESVAWRRDSDDVVAEVADHLFVSVEREMAGGADAMSAQRSSLTRFGDPRLVARAFASTQSGGIAMPTRFTKASGLFGMVASGLFLVALLTELSLQIPLLERDGLSPAEPAWLDWMAIFWLAGPAGFALATFGLYRRHGGALGRWGIIGISLVGIGSLVMVMPWMLGLYTLIAGAGFLILAVAALREGIAPRWALVMFGTGPLLAAGAATLAEIAGIGTRDYWGTSVMSSVFLLGVLVVVFLPGMFGLGRWLHREEVVDDIETPLAVS